MYIAYNHLISCLALFPVWPYFQPNKRFSFIISNTALSLLHISSIFKLHKLEESDVLLLCYFRDPASYSGLNDRLLTFIRNAFIKHYDLDIQVYPFSLTGVLSLLQIFNMFNEIYIWFREDLIVYRTLVLNGLSILRHCFHISLP